MGDGKSPNDGDANAESGYEMGMRKNHKIGSSAKTSGPRQ